MKKLPLMELKDLYRKQYVSRDDLAEILAGYEFESPAGREIVRRAIKLGVTLRLGELRRYWAETVGLYRCLNRREWLNRKFIKREQKEDYRIEGNRLDPQQIAAVVACEDAELILAPAGSGKTASLLAKLDYLTERLGIPAEKILVIAFTNKVVAELKERVKQTGIEIRTFHSLGNKIVKANLEGYGLVTERQTREFFRRAVQELYRRDPEYAKCYDAYLQAGEKDGFLDLITSERVDAEGLEALLITIQGLQKSERVDLVELKRRVEKIDDSREREKARELYRLYAPVAERYAKFLKKKRLYDFADMLNMATDLVLEMPKGSFGYQYILVDEAQDLSTSKILLLKAILDNCQKVKLFAVGDDWQSIYRFAGSNLKVLDDFERIFERETYRGMIELTYRFGQPTARISNKFIQKNPYQSKKKVVPHVQRRTGIEVRLNMDGRKRSVPADYEAVDGILQELYAKYGEGIFAKRIQIIARYNRDVCRLVREGAGAYRRASFAEREAEFEWRLAGTERKLKVPFCSMHKAKGITRDIIIVINANAGGHGVPATRGNHPMAEVLLAGLDAYPHAEERRLWYVAITRAKIKTFIVADVGRISPFVFEVSPKLSGAGVKVCPKCHRGIMQEKRRRDGKIYYGCPNCGWVK